MRIGLLVIAVALMGCMTRPYRSSTRGPSTHVTVRTPVGQVGHHYSTRITYRSNFIRKPQYGAWGTLPPGLSFDSSWGQIKGTPTKPGIWTVKVGVRDRVKGTHDQPAGQQFYYIENITIRVTDGSSTNHTRNYFPTPQRVSQHGGRQATWEIRNNTSHAVTVSYNGAHRGSLYIAAGSTRSTTLAPGTYSVSASSAKTTVRPYRGSVSFHGGWRYRNVFYIRTTR